MTNLIWPEREIIVAEEVPEGSGKWLVTLICGHKKYVKEKKVFYQCRACPKEEDPNDKSAA